MSTEDTTLIPVHNVDGVMYKSEQACCISSDEFVAKTWCTMIMMSSIHSTEPCVDMMCVYHVRLSTYIGWDHKWDLLVVESVHVIWVCGGSQLGGRGRVFALKRGHLGHFLDQIDFGKKQKRRRRRHNTAQISI